MYSKTGTQSLVSRLKKSMSVLSAEREKGNAEVKDNFHLLYRTYKAVVRPLSLAGRLPAGEFGYPRMFEYAYDFFRLGSGRTDRKTLEKYLEGIADNLDMTNSEICVTADIFRAAAIVYAAEKKSGHELSAVFSSLRFLEEYVFEDMYEKLSKCENVLLEDPYYADMDRKTKDLYRYRISCIAEKSGRTETETAAELVQRASEEYGDGHIGHLLFEKKKGRAYIFLTVLIPFLVCMALWTFSGILVAVLAFLPVWEICKCVLDFIYSHVYSATHVPAMNTDRGCEKTLVTYITVISNEKNVDDVMKNAEKCFFSNRCEGLMYGVLADFPESAEQMSDADGRLAEYLARKTEELNFRYRGRFFCALRRREQTDDGRYGGRERKRGAVEDFLHAVKGDMSCFVTVRGNISGATYFCALDSDTVPGIDSIKKLVGILEHPLSKPVPSADGRCAEKGYCIAAPRMDVSLCSSDTNMFTQIISGAGGTEVYGNASFCLYQDIYGQGIFAGKGVIDIDGFLRYTKDLFPQGRVLSHDILEGNFLGCAYASDVSFCDGVPRNIISYAKRGHRWIRGDVQNFFYMLPHIRTARGVIKNPLGYVARYKIFDNLRRTVTLPSVFLLMLFSLFLGAVPFIISVLCLFSGFFAFLASNIFSGTEKNAASYFSKTFSPSAQVFLRCGLDFAFLPFFAFTQTDGVIRAFIRLAEGKKLLEWTTAADADKKSGKTYASFLKRMLPQLTGLVFVLFLNGIPIAVLWTVFFFSAYFMSIPAPAEKKKMSVMQDMKDMWGYFADFLNEQNNFLPPDNFQEQPLGIVAHRTSPTNIGLAALSCLGALDCGFICPDAMLGILEKMTDSILMLKKHNGHPYNWYDTLTLEPLYPRYVSGVDNGNMAALLFALKNGLESMKMMRAEKLASKISGIISAMDLSFLYDKRKNLFYIGYDVERGEYSPSYYDLYASESRILSYFAVATRQVPAENWRSINRFVFRRDGKIGMKSWTGTAFEYFMPCILMPVIKSSLCDEMLCFASDMQIKYAAGRPWGLSESAFYSFDKSLNYRYKAIGVPALALKPESENEYVVSAYSSYLMLPLFTKAAAANIKRMKDMGLYGRYGLYEAADISSYCNETQVNTVKCYMAHHIGMSFLSCVNYMFGNIMQKRFMNPMMSAFQPLLEEKIPVSASKYKDSGEKRISRRAYFLPEYDCSLLDPYRPEVRWYTNGRISSVVTDCGTGNITYSGYDVTRYRAPRDPKGLFALYADKDTLLPLTFAPLYDRSVTYRTAMGPDECTYMSEKRDIEGRMSVTVSSSKDAEVREFALKNNSSKKREGTFLLYFEPVLSRRADEASHPAFGGLFTEAFYDDNVLVLHKRRRTSADTDIWLAVAFSEPFVFELSRFNVLDRIECVYSLAGAVEKPFSSSVLGPVDPCVCVKVRICLEAKEIRHMYSSVAVSDNRDTAVSAASSSLDLYSEARNAMRTADIKFRTERRIGKEDVSLAGILSSFVYAKRRGENIPREFRGRQGRECLWKYGISGDLPIISVKTDIETCSKCDSFIKAFVLIRHGGIMCELVFLYSDSGRYDRPVYGKLLEIAESSRVSDMIGVKGGIIFADTSDMETTATVACASCFYADLAKGWQVREKRRTYSPEKVLSGLAEKKEYVYPTGIGGFTEKGFAVTEKDAIPSRPEWCHIIASDNFGTVVSDSSLGSTYALNSQQNRLTEWSNDSVRGSVGEKIYYRCKGKKYDVIRGASAEFLRGFAVYNTVCSESHIAVTVFVCAQRMAKLMRVQVKNDADTSAVISFYADVILGVNSSGPSAMRSVGHRGVMFENPFNVFSPSGVCYITGAGTTVRDGSVSSFISAKSSKTLYFVLGFEESRTAAESSISYFSNTANCEKEIELSATKRNEEPHIKISTGNSALDMLFNTFLAYQVTDCRIKARTGFYQSSGAFGFRDQLQDCLCISLLDSLYLRRQILLACARQFEEGDVMHWWHGEKTVTGVRTNSSDDLLWLPLCVAEYLKITDDDRLLDEKVSYIKSPPLAEGENERYGTAEISEKKEDVYTHCVCALTRAMRTGIHGLISFGSGDWNDGMNGFVSGESVWCSMFAVIILEKFAEVAKLRGDTAFLQSCLKNAEDIRRNTEKYAWDNDRYIRGFADGQQRIGAHECSECAIDLLPQTFASLCGGFDAERTRTALASAKKYLVDRQNGIVRLFDPPFSDGDTEPGYIKGYIKGVRENGGQYTHAAVWYALALMRSGQYDSAAEILDMINPVNHSKTYEDVRKYRIEPYVIAGDVYSNPGHPGMGGWSHYTGAAGWYFKTVAEEMLGFERRGNKLFVFPHLPESIPSYSADIFIQGTRIKLCVEKGQGGLTVDGKKTEFIPLDYKKHKAHLFCGNLMLHK